MESGSGALHIPRGFTFAVAAAGFKRKGKLDLALMLSDREAALAGVFTRNLFKAAPVLHCMEALKKRPVARGFLVNSGQANACTGQEGMANCRAALALAAAEFGLEPHDLLPASTGVIGAQLKMDLWKQAVPLLVRGKCEPLDAARAIMTTDTMHKICSSSVSLSGGEVRLMGLAKGAGMICPDMATLLGFAFCDAEVDPSWWQETLAWCVDESFNKVTIDGDTSTNDTFMALANGASGVKAGSEKDREALKQGLLGVCRDLAYLIVQDAEGGTKVARINVSGAEDDAQAELAARAVGHSPLVKTALFGSDPNWGRVVAAVGRSGARFDPEALVLSFGEAVAFRKGCPAPGDLDALLGPLMKKEHVEINISIGDGPGVYSLLASDLTRDYVSINADYRS